MYGLTIITICICCICYFFDYQLIADILVCAIITGSAIGIVCKISTFHINKLKIFLLGANILFAYQLLSVPTLLSGYIQRYHQCVDTARKMHEFKSFIVTKVAIKNFSHSKIWFQPIDNSSIIFFGDIASDRLMRQGIEIDASIRAVKQHPTLFAARQLLAQLSLLYQPASTTCQVQINWWKSNSIKSYTQRVDEPWNRLKIKQPIFKSLLNYSADHNYASMVTAMTLGKYKSLNPDIIEKFQLTGTIHLLVISGLHAGILILVLGFLVMITVRLAEPLYVWIVPLIMVSAFTWLNEYSVSLLRVWMMLCVYCLQLVFFHRQWPIVTIGIPFAMSLLLAPDSILSPGFIMSYGLVAYIVILFSQVQKVNIFSLQAGISIWSIPLCAAAGLWYSPVAFICNILAVPLFSISLPFHFIAVIDSFITGGSFVQLPSYWLYKLLLLWISWCAEFVTIHGDWVNSFTMVIRTIPIFALIVFMISRYLGVIPKLLGSTFAITALASMMISYSNGSLERILRSKTTIKTQEHIQRFSSVDAFDDIVAISQNNQAPSEVSIILRPSTSYPSIYYQFSKPDTSLWVKYTSTQARYYAYVDWFTKNMYEIQPQCNFLLNPTLLNSSRCEAAAIFHTKWYIKGYHQALGKLK